MAEIPLQSRLDKSLNFTQTFLKKSKQIKNSTVNESPLTNDTKHDNTHLALLMENQRIEDAFLIKESESKKKLNNFTDKKVASKLLERQEQVLALKTAHDQVKSNLKSVMDDLQTVIIENQKLNSEKLIDNQNITTVKVENQDLTRKLSHLQNRFSKFVQESLKMTSREDELITLLEDSEEKLGKQGRELERESEKSRLLKEENDALMQLSIGTWKF
jgi:hypothetical protein